MSFTSSLSRAIPAAFEDAPPDAPRDTRGLYLALGSGAAVYFYFHLFRFPFVPIWHWGDQSIFLDHAEHMLDGQALYRDLFQLNLPGTEYLYYFLFLCFGVRMWIAPLAACITLTAAALLVFSLSRTVLRGPASLLPAIAFTVICLRGSLDGAHHLFSTALVFLAINLIARARGSLSIFCAGAVLGLSALFTSSRGVSLAVGVSLFFIWQLRGWRTASAAIAALLAPFLAVIAASVAYLATTVAPRTLYESLVTFPLRYYSAGRFNTPSVSFAELQSALPPRAHSVLLIGLWLVSKALPAILLIAFVVSHLRRNPTAQRGSQSSKILVLCAFAGTFAFFAAGASLSLARINCAVAFAYILGAAMLAESGRHQLVSALLALAVATACIEGTVATIRPAYKFDSPQGSILIIDRERDQVISWLSRNARPGDQLFGDPDLNFVLSLRNPAAVQWVEPDAFTRPQQVKELLNSLALNHTRFFVWSEFADHPGHADSLAPLRVYLKSHYHPALEFGNGARILAVNADHPLDR